VSVAVFFENWSHHKIKTAREIMQQDSKYKKWLMVGHMGRDLIKVPDFKVGMSLQWKNKTSICIFKIYTQLYYMFITPHTFNSSISLYSYSSTSTMQIMIKLLYWHLDYITLMFDYHFS
jgi:hypothetical protein